MIFLAAVLLFSLVASESQAQPIGTGGNGGISKGDPYIHLDPNVREAFITLDVLKKELMDEVQYQLKNCPTKIPNQILTPKSLYDVLFLHYLESTQQNKEVNFGCLVEGRVLTILNSMVRSPYFVKYLKYHYGVSDDTAKAMILFFKALINEEKK